MEAGPQDAAHLQAPTRHQTPARGLSGARDTVWTRAMTRVKRLASCLVPRGGAKDPEDDLTDGEMARLLAQEELHRSDEIHDRTQGGMQADTRPDTYTGKSQTQQAARVPPPKRKRCRPRDTGHKKSDIQDRPPRGVCATCCAGLGDWYTMCACGRNDHKFCKTCMADDQMRQAAAIICSDSHCHLPGIRQPNTRAHASETLCMQAQAMQRRQQAQAQGNEAHLVINGARLDE